MQAKAGVVGLCRRRAVVVHRSSKKSSVHRLYDIDIIDEKDYKVKIHYVKYSAKHDEWISKSEVAYKPTSSFVSSTKTVFFTYFFTENGPMGDAHSAISHSRRVKKLLKNW